MTDMTCTHIDTCLGSFLHDHHNRDGELLLGVFVDGSATYGDVRNELFAALNEAGFAACDQPGFDFTKAREAINDLFADVHPMTMDRGLFDASLDILTEEDDDPGEMVQAWFLLTWKEED